MSLTFKLVYRSMNTVDFHDFSARSYLILTDNGGIQEEAPSLGKTIFMFLKFAKQKSSSTIKSAKFKEYRRQIKHTVL